MVGMLKFCSLDQIRSKHTYCGGEATIANPTGSQMAGRGTALRYVG